MLAHKVCLGYKKHVNYNISEGDKEYGKRSN